MSKSSKQKLLIFTGIAIIALTPIVVWLGTPLLRQVACVDAEWQNLCLGYNTPFAVVVTALIPLLLGTVLILLANLGSQRKSTKNKK